MSDTNFSSYADLDGVHVSGKVFDPGTQSSGFSDVLKFSHLTRATFEDIEVDAGDAKENAIDANRRCAEVLVYRAKLSGGKQASIVTKGGCENMEYDTVVIVPHPDAPQDILWDDFSDQSRKPSTGTLRRVIRPDMKPVRVVFGRFSCPKLLEGNYKILWLRTIGLHLRNLALDLGVILRLVKLPAGCPVSY